MAHRRWTDDELVDHVRRWLADGGTGRIMDYRAWANSANDAPGDAVVSHRLGGWRRALDLAECPNLRRRSDRDGLAESNADAEWLRGRYVDDGWTIRRIGEELGVHEVTARKWMLKAGIELRPLGRRANDLEEVVRRYRAGATTAELAAAYHVKVGTVQGWLHHAGLTERHPPHRPRPAAELDDAQWLHRRYVTEAATLQTIADELGCVPQTVRQALIRHGIPRRPRGPARTRA